MENYEKYLFPEDNSIREALIRIDELATQGATLFVVDDSNNLLGTVTDGDIRRGLIKGVQPDDSIMEVIHDNPKFVRKGENELNQLIEFRSKDILLVPVLEKDSRKIFNILNLKSHRSYLPIDAIIMAGGQGNRLRPLTESKPKPLLEVGGIPIIERNIDRLAMYGIDDVTISVNYLGEQLEAYFGDGSKKGISLNYLWEKEPLGTIGAVGMIENFENEYVLIMNSDLLTNIDFESFFIDFIESGADLSILSIPYQVDIPYAVFENEGNKVLGLREKPKYTYYSNGGIYLTKRNILDRIPKGSFYNATDLIESVIADNGFVKTYPLVDYWLDIGNHEDFKKAQADVHHIMF